MTLLVGAILILPSLVLAASTTTGLVPCDGAAYDIGGGKQAVACHVCHAVELGQRIINFLVGIASFLANAMYGRGIVPGNPDAYAWTNIAKGFEDVLLGAMRNNIHESCEVSL